MKRVGFLFPGQGSQAVGMGKDFYENSEVAREIIDRCSDASGIDFKALLFEENELLQQTQYTQPAILLVSAVAQKLFENEMPIKPQFALGHSLGEFSALVSVGALDIEDAVKLVHLRGKLMAQACEGKGAGMMAVLGLDDTTVASICKESKLQVWPANYNSDGQVVVAGLKEDLAKLEPLLKEQKAKRTVILPMSVASHCPILESAVEQFGKELDKVIKDEFIAPVISNVTAKAYDSKAQALELLPQQLVSPVKYKHAVKAYENEIECFIEFGQGVVLKGLNRKITKKPTFNVSDIASLEKTIENLRAENE
ncbi:MAG: ACP S-malonyltransferase [Campylobacterota bacterium]